MELQLLGLVLLSMILGAIIGYERETADKPAGLRTHMLVAGAAALLTAISRVLVIDFGPSDNLIQADPIRVVEAVITGVSFLGAGTIIRERSNGSVEGLTTAASLLFASAIGIGVALEQFVLTGGVTLLVLITVRGVKRAEKQLDI